jgi:hypothetical protein
MASEKSVKNSTRGGSWKPGQSGNPKGRPQGTGKLSALRESIMEHVPAIVEQLVEQAKGGDVQAIRLLLERVFPPIKATEQAVHIEMPKGGTLTAKAESVLCAAADGLLAPTQAAQLISALGTVAKISEIDELTARIAKLEEQHAKP